MNDEDHDDLLAETREIDVRGLRDREAREHEVERRAVEVERVARGHDEARDATRNAELDERLEELRERGLTRGGRVRGERRLSDGALMKAPRAHAHHDARPAGRRSSDEAREARAVEAADDASRSFPSR
jgi:hypothetical protein